MEQTISMGMAVGITACALLAAALGPTLSQMIRSRTFFDSHLSKSTGRHSLPIDYRTYLGA